MAGAFYGEAAIPERWRARLALRELIVEFADRLFDLAESVPAANEETRSGR